MGAPAAAGPARCPLSGTLSESIEHRGGGEATTLLQSKDDNGFPSCLAMADELRGQTWKVAPRSS